ncbi:putative nuclear divisionprotein rft1 [Rosellinia necatrix]|uniref:Putative nuclear divisionprotein rft1 n=1 Tax=Rosellinia necatrix TaxID=77044 RepID=A0A1W2TLP2_ROSNE|nr:putative nuclear divisionprotein rft1 [Rosellinia necatrix]
MVDAMTRPLDSWGHDLCAPRHASYYHREQNTSALRLPPPSSLVNDAHHRQVVLNGRERASPSHSSYRDVYAPVASLPAHRPTTQAPILGPEGHTSVINPPDRRPAGIRTRPSPTHSSTASDRSEDPPDHLRPHPFKQEQRSSPAPRPSSHLVSVHKSPSRQSPCVGIQPIGPSQNVHSQHTRLGLSPQDSSPVHQMWSPRSESRATEQRMKIADLLSNEQSSAAPRSPRKAPQRDPAATSTYRISIRQQPVAARSCGYGERDRRVIDPPPIIQMSIEDPTATEEEIRNRLTHSYSIMHCTIWNELGDQDLSSMPEDYRTQRRLMGTVVSSPFAGHDEKDEYGCFFCFPDLSCRTPGSFRLQFSFMVLDPHSTPGHRTPVVALVMSDIFTVYNAKDFPGMKASTPLTKRLKEQGCLISIKKGNDRTRAREESESEDDYDEDANGGSGGGQRRPKRVKKS